MRDGANLLDEGVRWRLELTQGDNLEFTEDEVHSDILRRKKIGDESKQRGSTTRPMLRHQNDAKRFGRSG